MLLDTSYKIQEEVMKSDDSVREKYIIWFISFLHLSGSLGHRCQTGVRGAETPGVEHRWGWWWGVSRWEPSECLRCELREGGEGGSATASLRLLPRPSSWSTLGRSVGDTRERGITCQSWTGECVLHILTVLPKSSRHRIVCRQPPKSDADPLFTLFLQAEQVG